jgi:hypothetical protein
MGLPIGPTPLKFTLPSGVIQSQIVNLVGGYNVIYIRMFKNRAVVLISNDPAALPPKPVVSPPTPPAVAPIAPPVTSAAPNSPSPSTTPSPASSNMEGLKPDEQPNLLNSIQQLFN